MTTGTRFKATVASGVLALVLAGCSNGGGDTPSTGPTSGVSSTTTPSKTPGPTTTSPPGSAIAPPNGTYLNGPVGTPHTYIVVTDGAAGSFSGSVVFLYQDGSTSTEFGFAGMAGSGSIVLTTNGGGPGMITATYAPRVIILTGCSRYLAHVQTSADCTFTYSSSSSTPPG